MAQGTRTTRRRFLKASAAGAALAASLAPGRVIGAPAINLKRPIKVGGMGIMSGPLGGYGEFMKKGAILAAEEINDAGGVGGNKIELDFRDDELKPDVGVRNARYFVDQWGADFVIGIDSSGVALAVGQVMPSLGKILIVTHGATEKYNEELVYKKGLKQLFRTSVPVYQDAIASAFIAKDFPVKRWATVSPDYEYGHTSWKMFKATLTRLKPDVEFVAESFAKFGTVDFSSHISKVMASSPEAIFSTEWGGEAVTLVKQAKLFRVFDSTKAVMVAMGSAMDVLEGLGKEYPEGTWASGRYWFQYPETETNRRFVERFRKRWNTYPHYVSETSYAALHMIKRAVEQAGSIDTDKLIPVMEGMTLDRPAGRSVIRKEDHQAVYEVPWGQITHDPKYPMPVLTNLKVASASDYYRNPPFPPVEG
ncbi:MAG TPA: ABC transporter substrate-binding protein [Thermodesulfobacteriota bacterium]